MSDFSFGDWAEKVVVTRVDIGDDGDASELGEFMVCTVCDGVGRIGEPIDCAADCPVLRVRELEQSIARTTAEVGKLQRELDATRADLHQAFRDAREDLRDAVYAERARLAEELER